ncbi:hypothetical protein DBR06_SOUSAS4810048, partial [Sousa chinensis]
TISSQQTRESFSPTTLNPNPNIHPNTPHI